MGLGIESLAVVYHAFVSPDTVPLNWEPQILVSVPGLYLFMQTAAIHLLPSSLALSNL